MKVILILLLCCNLILDQSKDLKSFMQNFEQMNFPFEINENQHEKNSNLFSKGFNRNDYLKFLNEIKENTTEDMYFYYGAKAKFKEFDILIYRMTKFQDAPGLDTIKIDLVVFNSAAKMISKMTIGGQKTENIQINCVINEDMKFVISTFNASKELINKHHYFINNEGKILLQN